MSKTPCMQTTQSLSSLSANFYRACAMLNVTFKLGTAHAHKSKQHGTSGSMIRGIRSSYRIVSEFIATQIQCKHHELECLE